MTRRAGTTTAVAALLTAVVFVLAGTVGGSRSAAEAQSSSAGVCPDADGVTVVVDFRELGGETIVRCAHGAHADGAAALEAAGVEVAGTNRWGRAFVCRLNGLPTARDEPCVDTPPQDAYWSYWHAVDGGEWTSSGYGVQNRTPEEGTFEGWSFSTGSAGPRAPRVDPVRPAPDPEPAPPTPDPPSSGGSSSDDDGPDPSPDDDGPDPSPDDDEDAPAEAPEEADRRDAADDADRARADATDTATDTDTDGDEDEDMPSDTGAAADAATADAATDDDHTSDDDRDDDRDEDASGGRDTDEVDPRAQDVPTPPVSDGETTDTLASDEVRLRAGGRSPAGTLVGLGLVAGVGSIAGVTALRRRRRVDPMSAPRARRPG